MNKECPICKGSGKIEPPHSDMRDWKKSRRLMAKTLLDNGYSIRQVAKFCGYGSTRSVQILKLKKP